MSNRGRNKNVKILLGNRGLPVLEAENFTSVSEPIV
jgi:hypothetical protein